MRKKIQIGFFISVAFLCSLFFVQAASVFQTIQGGTGTSSPSGILYGSGSASPLKTVSIGSNLTFSGGTLSATDTSFSTTSASYFSSLGLAFSTTSSSHFTSVGLSFSTTSSDYWLTQRQGASFSTTSANYWSTFGLAFSTTSTDYYMHSSSTVPTMYKSNTWSALNIFSSGLISSASSTFNTAALNVDVLHFAGTSSVPYRAGNFYYNSTEDRWDMHLTNCPASEVHPGNTWETVRNNTGSTIAKGKPVYVTGNHGGTSFPTVALAQAETLSGSGTLTTTQSIGITMEAIANNAFGCVQTLGSVDNLDTSAYTAGQVLFLSTTTAGAFVTFQPYSPDVAYRVGTVLRSHATLGRLYIRPGVTRIGLLTETYVPFGSPIGFLNQDSSFLFSTTSKRLTFTHGSSTSFTISGSAYIGNATSTTFFASLASSTNLFSTFATTSKLTVTDYASTTALTISGVRSAALITSATGVVSGASATTCTNQFVRSISAVMVGTCASISNADWSGTDLSVANGGTGLSTFGGSGTVLFTTAADTLSSDTDMTYDGTRNRLTLLHASTTAVGVTGALYLPTAHFNATRNGIGSTTPSSLWLNSLSSTTVLQQGQFVVGISSSTVLGTTQTVNWNTGNHQRFILNAATNFVLNSTSSNPLDGGKYTLELCQDGTGSRTATFVTGNTHIRWKNNATTTITATANKCSLIYFIYEATYSMYRGVGSTTNISIN